MEAPDVRAAGDDGSNTVRAAAIVGAGIDHNVIPGSLTSINECVAAVGREHFPGSGERRARRWCLLVLVVLEIRARVTAPAKFWQRRREFPGLALEDRRSQQPGARARGPRRSPQQETAQWLRAQ
jgi:hypothetical protein